jgi:hypothetical protein
MATITRSNVERALGSVLSNLSEENYAQSFASYRFVFELAQTYSQVPFNLVFDSIRKHRGRLTSPGNGIFFPATLLILRFASEAQSDSVLALHSAGLRHRLCTSILDEFFNVSLGALSGLGGDNVLANFIAHGANLGLIEETAIRQHILQLLTTTSHSTLHSYQAEMLCVLFKLAGATFDAYADPSVIDRCFKLLRDYSIVDSWRRGQIQVRELYEGSLIGAKINCRRYFDYVKVVGRVCHPHPYSQPADQSKPTWARKIPAQLPLLHLWGCSV